MDANAPAAGKPDTPGGLIGDAELQHLCLAGANDLQCFGDNGGFDAPPETERSKLAPLSVTRWRRYPLQRPDEIGDSVEHILEQLIDQSTQTAATG